MPDNFFTDNADLQFHLDSLDLAEVVGIKEEGYRFHREVAAAPRNYADALDTYRRILTRRCLLRELSAGAVDAATHRWDPRLARVWPVPTRPARAGSVLGCLGHP